MRRRALLAASMPRGGQLDTWLQFPLYFDFDSVDEEFFVVYLTRAPDDTSVELSLFLANYLIENCFVWGDNVTSYYELNNPSDIGIEIYFKNLKVIKIGYNIADTCITLHLNGEYEVESKFGRTWTFSEVYLRDEGNGEFFMEGLL